MQVSADLTRDELAEAFDHATAGDWRRWAAYVDALLDAALTAALPTKYDH